MHVLLVGPDGTGKTTLAEAIRELDESASRPVLTGHWRPGVLRPPPPDRGPVTQPHADVPRRADAAVAKLLLAFADHLIGGYGRWRRARRSGLLITERGWYDQRVDPLRYRLPSWTSSIVACLGPILPKPDIAVLLAGDPTVIHKRKPELAPEEIQRQIDAWRQLLPQVCRTTLEVDSTASDVTRVAAEVVRHTQRGDLVLRRVLLAPRRLRLLSTPGRASRAAQGIYKPERFGGKLRRIAGRALVPVAPRVAAPESVVAALQKFNAPVSGIAVHSSAGRPSRHVVGLAQGDALAAVAKCGDAADSGLRREREFLKLLQHEARGFRVPTVRWSGDVMGQPLVLMDAVPPGVRKPTVVDAVEIATALHAAEIVHGDLAPWNVIVGEGGYVLLDWEEARTGLEPLHDLVHFVLKAGALHRSWSPEKAAEILTREGGPGRTYLHAIGEHELCPRDLVSRYLDSTAGVWTRPEQRFRARLERLIQ